MDQQLNVPIGIETPAPINTLVQMQPALVVFGRNENNVFLGKNECGRFAEKLHPAALQLISTRGSGLNFRSLGIWWCSEWKKQGVLLAVERKGLIVGMACTGVGAFAFSTVVITLALRALMLLHGTSDYGLLLDFGVLVAVTAGLIAVAARMYGRMGY